jgi:hypothetical protein
VLSTLTPLLIQNIATLYQPFNLHVLSTPPAFVLSQNQTLRLNITLLLLFLLNPFSQAGLLQEQFFVAADCSAAGLFTHRAFQFSMNSTQHTLFRSDRFKTFSASNPSPSLPRRLPADLTAQPSTKKPPFQATKNSVEDCFSFNQLG